jgi:hypothetical protein
MLSKKAKKIILTSLITVSALLLVLLLTRIVFIDSIIISGRCDKYIEDYNEFIFRNKEYEPLFALRFGGAQGPKYQLWFLPFQRERMRSQIREDVITILESAMENNSDIIAEYRISDDFRYVYIYYYKDTLQGKHGQELSLLEANIKIELYHQLIHGYRKTALDRVLRYVEVEES